MEAGSCPNPFSPTPRHGAGHCTSPHRHLSLEAPGDRYLCPTRQVHPSLARSSTPRLPLGHQLLSCSSLKGRIPVWARHDNGGIEAPDGMMLARVLPSCTEAQRTPANDARSSKETALHHQRRYKWSPRPPSLGPPPGFIISLRDDNNMQPVSNHRRCSPS